MSHLPGQEIYHRISGSVPLIANTPQIGSVEFGECLQADSFDLRVGVVVAGGEVVADQRKPAWRLPPGEMAIIITEETVNMPGDLAGEVSARLSILNDGVLVLAAPHVDPGYRGPLTARVINLMDKPYRMAFGTPMLTIRFYELKERAERPVTEVVSTKKKIEKALKESRDTFNRLFIRPEELVLRKNLRSAAATQALTWLALLVPAIAVIMPFSIPFFWDLGKQLSSTHPELLRPVLGVAGVLLLPLAILYVVAIIKLFWLIWRGARSS